MSVTADAHTLSPGPGLLDAMVNDHAALGLTRLIRQHTHERFDVRAGAALALRTLIARARRHGPSAFRARLGGAHYVLSVRRLKGGSFVVVSVRRASRGQTSNELEVSRAFSLTLTWAPRRTLGSFLSSPASGGGIYIVEKNDVPRYVGMATDFASRYKSYAHALNAFAVPTRSYHIRTGSTSGTGTLRDAEHAVIRAITKHFGRKVLTNRSSFLAFRASGSGVTLKNKGARPSYLPASVRVASGTQYESEPLAA